MKITIEHFESRYIRQKNNNVKIEYKNYNIFII